jgi:predicted benzoate:H+ symporter BenE
MSPFMQTVCGVCRNLGNGANHDASNMADSVFKFASSFSAHAIQAGPLRIWLSTRARADVHAGSSSPALAMVRSNSLNAATGGR